MSDIQNKIINSIIETEGGYVNDLSDSGGETNYGITEAVAWDAGYTGTMRELPRQLAFDIYVELYWEPLQLSTIELLSEKIAEEVADTSVNMGVSRAAKFMQRSLTVLNNKQILYPDLIVDGKFGNKTISALSDFLTIRRSEGESVLLKMLNCLQGAFYIELSERREKDEKFIYGWFKNRIEIGEE